MSDAVKSSPTMPQRRLFDTRRGAMGRCRIYRHDAAADRSSGRIVDAARASRRHHSGEAFVMRIGAHMSVAGGISLAVDRAALHGCEALQIFSRNANRWLAPPLDPAEVGRFRARLVETGIGPAVSHASYLINLA